MSLSHNMPPNEPYITASYNNLAAVLDDLAQAACPTLAPTRFPTAFPTAVPTTKVRACGAVRRCVRARASCWLTLAHTFPSTVLSLPPVSDALSDKLSFAVSDELPEQVSHAATNDAESDDAADFCRRLHRN